MCRLCLPFPLKLLLSLTPYGKASHFAALLEQPLPSERVRGGRTAPARILWPQGKQCVGACPALTVTYMHVHAACPSGRTCSPVLSSLALFFFLPASAVCSTALSPARGAGRVLPHPIHPGTPGDERGGTQGITVCCGGGPKLVQTLVEEQ